MNQALHHSGGEFRRRFRSTLYDSPDHRYRQLLHARVARAREERLLFAPPEPSRSGRKARPRSESRGQKPHKPRHYPSEETFALALARVLNFELKELVRAGATELQIDEPYYSGFPEDLAWAVGAINAMVDGVKANVTLHICYGNRYGKPSF